MKSTFIASFLLILFLSACDKDKISDESISKDGFSAVKVDDFTLLDHKGISHQLSYYDDAEAVVIMIHGNGCPIVRNALPDYEKLKKQFENKNIRFFLLNSNIQDTFNTIALEAEEWGVTIPILVDDDQLIGESLNLSRTAEILIIDPKQREIVYRGPLSDRIGYEVQKNKAANSYVSDALSAILVGKKIIQADYPTKGCLINFPYKMNAIPVDISYVDDIAPLLIDKCQGCHNDKGIGSWSMSSYEMVLGFAPMIREVVRAKRMPPWDADPSIGEWKHDGSLTIQERRSLVHWVEQGALRGDGEDLLLKSNHDFTSDWSHGQPDLIVELPEFKVPASGLVDYQYPFIANPLDEDVWVVGLDIKPGDPKTLHHMFVGVSQAKPDLVGGNQDIKDDLLRLWGPGNHNVMYPEGTAILLKAGTTLTLEMHYTTYGRETVDATQLGFYLSKEPPNKILRYSEINNVFMRIPPQKREHQVQAYHYIERDIHLHMLGVHAHYRGKSARFILEYPDGRREILLSVPDYDFNWQLGYRLESPKAVPMGSRLIYQTIFDNSIYNDQNPDPSREVTWGLQGEDEMLFGPFLFTWDEETPSNIIHDIGRLQSAILMGSIDQNMDGQIEPNEVPKSYKRKFYPMFHRGDKNKDKKLSQLELMDVYRW